MVNHLGGHNFVTHVDIGVLKYFYDLHDCRYMLDVGCGPAGNVFAARGLGYNSVGIDGDPELQFVNKSEYLLPIIMFHDYTTGTFFKTYKFSDLSKHLVLSTEFLEHVEEQYIPNIMDTFQRAGKYVCITHALPGELGGLDSHHVNCQSEQYWIDKFKEYGFEFSPDLTHCVRKESTMKRDFMRKTGKVFINKGVI